MRRSLAGRRGFQKGAQMVELSQLQGKEEDSGRGSLGLLFQRMWAFTTAVCQSSRTQLWRPNTPKCGMSLKDGHQLANSQTLKRMADGASGFFDHLQQHAAF